MASKKDATTAPTVPDVADPNVLKTLDEKIQPKEPVTLATIDINLPVTPGHDMVVNHINGDQETAQGHIALAIMEQEASDPTKTVSPSEVTAEAQENPRTPDPEVNGPSVSEQPEETPAPEATPEESDVPAPDSSSDESGDSK